MFRRWADLQPALTAMGPSRGLSRCGCALTFGRATGNAAGDETFNARGAMTGSQKPHADEMDAVVAVGDASAWLAEHGDVLYRYARSRVGHRQLAEDLVQDALLAALQSRERFEGRASVRTWLLSILRHKIIDNSRRAGKSIAATEGETQSAPGNIIARYFSAKGLWKKAVGSWQAPEQTLEDREFWDVLDGCLGQLPRSLKAPFVLREIDELDPAELRRILGLSEVNLRVRLHRARLLLRECLEIHWFGAEPQDGTRTIP
jgi:RNA polymerase sigma-70 factor (ECF subfamily)